ncbi:2-oxoglutarate-dependent dioxygenase htyE-like isoform X2 [Homalodisca vitripennis]|uniref:2-oxoglutarate-dependent dioxygenase htyE-like isoform X2 n=1 Tax=Homalodisca vitripennis TaxID=197043 RepID=UPI001EEA3FA2|nr:2-oxoglutarate-dependent dioxygenase htyE-like isoform X2 [Homalodisca vitripennis]
MEKIEEPSTDTLLSRNEIPIIDLAYMGPVTTPIKPWLRKIADQLNRSLSTKGLVFLVNHGITEERLKAVYKIMDKFCDLPDDIKNVYRLNPPEDNQGYVPAGMERFNREWRREMRHSYNIQNFSRKIPTKEIPNFEDTVGGVAEEFRRLASILLQIIAVSLDLGPDKFLSFHKGMLKQDNASTFRMLYYPPLGEAPLPYATRCGEHTDYGTFTLLTQDTEGGLEVYTGGKWCSVGHLPGAILVNLGELIESWSSSRYKAIKHRVVIPDESKLRTRSRHSIAFFVHPDDNTVVDPAMFLPPSPAENVEEHRHITLMTAYQHLQQRLRQSRLLKLWQRLRSRFRGRNAPRPIPPPSLEPPTPPCSRTTLLESEESRQL